MSEPAAARRYAFVESNTTGTGRIAIDRLLARGDEVVFFTDRAARYPFLARSRPRLDVVTVDTNDVEAVVDSLGQARSGGRIDAIVSFSTFYATTVATVGARIGLPALNPRAAVSCHDKPRLRGHLREAGLPSPSFWVVDSAAAARRCAAEISYPCVVKPVDGSGSNGVLLVGAPQALLDHCALLLAQVTNERGQPAAGRVMVETFLDGPEVSVETLTTARGCTTVIGVTRKHLSEPPLFVETGHDFPARLPEARRLAVERAAVDALDAVGFDFGPAHTEIRLTREGPVVVEVNPRLAGGMIPELVRLAIGIDPILTVLDLAAGASVSLTESRREAASIRFICARQPGRLGSIGRWGDRCRHELVRAIEFDKTPGTLVRPPASATDRLGYVIASGADPDAVAAAADACRSTIEQELAIEPADHPAHAGATP